MIALMEVNLNTGAPIRFTFDLNFSPQRFDLAFGNI